MLLNLQTGILRMKRVGLWGSFLKGETGLVLGYLKQIGRHPPGVIFRKGIEVLSAQTRALPLRLRDKRQSSYSDVLFGQPLNSYLPKPSVDMLAGQAEKMASLSRHITAHQFNLLGSGWCDLGFGAPPSGIEEITYQTSEKPRINPANRQASERIAALISKDYQPIDWQRDFRSGYQWQADCWYLDIPYAHLSGVDIKLPWELARMHHLVWLAQAYVLSREGTPGFTTPDVYLAEYCNQVLDFAAHNPPRFGVNWRGPMDCAIRASNLLISFDLLHSSGAAFSEEFLAVFTPFIHAHGIHIFNNLEDTGGHRANHYLADVTGLMWIAAYLPATSETDQWLTFSTHEFRSEMLRQFLPDGGGFEASTSYHRLSLEMLVYGCALIRTLPQSRGGGHLTPHHLERLHRAVQFTQAITKPGGQAVQVGDNDSGRFFKLNPACHRTDDDELQETCLDHSHLLSAASGLFADLEAEITIETAIIRHLSGNPGFKGQPHPPSSAPPLPIVPTGRLLLQAEINVHGGDLTRNLTIQAFPDFGLYIYKSDRMFLSIRCGKADYDGRGAHAHLDQLSVELSIDGEDWIRDPGSYLYTPLPERRNQYRSVHSHFAPQLPGQEPGNLQQGLFTLPDTAKGQCLGFDAHGFVGCHQGYGDTVYRYLTLSAERITIQDIIEGEPEQGSPTIITCTGRKQTIAALQPSSTFSPGYGRRES